MLERALSRLANLPVEAVDFVVEEGEFLFVLVELVAECPSVASSADEAGSGEHSCGAVELSACLETFLLERESPFPELAALLRERSALGWFGWGCCGIEGERLGGAAGERVCEPVDGFGGLGAVR
jgi:hypothetical protein